MPRARRLLSLVIAGAGLLASLAASPLLSQWSAIPPPAGGTVQDVLFEATTPGLVFAAHDRGFYRSADSGQTWQLVLPNGPPDTVFVRQAGSAILAGGIGLFRSLDGGTIWTESMVNPAGPPNVLGLAVDPSDPTVVLVTANYSDGKIFASSDGGQIFADTTADLPNAPLAAVAITPTGTYLVGGTLGFPGLFRSTTSGASWTAVPSLAAQGVTVIEPSSLVAGTVHVGTQADGVYRSIDDGATFVAVNTGFTGTGVHDIEELADGSYVLASRDAGIFTSTDGLIWVATTALAEEPLAVAEDPNAPGHLLVGTTDPAAIPVGLFRSANLGVSWSASSAGMTAPINVLDLAISPLDPNNVIALLPPSAMLIAHQPLLIVTADRFTSSATGPFQAARLAGSPSGAFFASGSTAFFRVSTDGGLTWSASNLGLPSALYGGIAISAADPQVIWLGASSALAAVYRSVDGGASWLASASGLPTSLVDFALAAGHADPLVAFFGDSLFGAGAFRTVDGGGSWTPAGFAGENVLDLAVDPVEGTLFAVAGSGGARIWSSPDQGVQWNDITGTLAPDLLEVEVDSAGGVVYVRTLSAPFVHASIDGGATWIPLGNAPFGFTIFGSTLWSDPSVSRRLYAADGRDLFTADLGLVLDSADLRLSKEAAPTAALPGELVTFTLTVENDGPASADNAVVVDTLPAGLLWESDDCAAGSPVAGVITWNIGNLASGDSAVCEVTVRVDPNAAPSSVLENAASATSDAPDPTEVNATAAATVQVLASALAIPTLGGVGIAALALLLAIAGLAIRRSPAG